VAAPRPFDSIRNRCTFRPAKRLHQYDSGPHSVSEAPKFRSRSLTTLIALLPRILLEI